MQGRWLALCAGLALAICFTLCTGTALAATDWDGDGYADNDCAPLDPAVHPGAVDKPDLNFEDTNCDGIDGDLSKAIFVTLGGNDGAPGTLTNPKRTINAAVTAAAAAGRDVYVAGGEYVESVNLADNVGIYGGYEPITGKRSAEQVTSIKNAPAALAFGDSGVVLQLLTLDGQQDGSGNAYGLRAVKDGANPSSVLLENVITKAAAAGGPVNGVFRGNGVFGAGFGGGSGGLGHCGDGPGFPGFSGLGLGGLGGGRGGILGDVGAPGAVGFGGSNAGNNVVTKVDQATWPRTAATTGGDGGPGGGGGGGRGGAGVSIFLFGDACGGNGAAGGNGGSGGLGGGGGLNGAGSFGAFLLDSSLVAQHSTFNSGTGGAGGNGANGGIGGGGSLGSGLTSIGLTCVLSSCGTNGFGGGAGGAGGLGGGGGGGAGGPSAGVYQAGPGSSFVARDGTTTVAAPGGLGGLQGNGGARAANGGSESIMRSATAPASASADFDGDGITDAADACPDVAGGTTDANGDGCPDRPAKLADANGNGIPDSAEASSNTSNNTGTAPPSGGGSGPPPSGGGSGAPAATAPTPRVAAKLVAAFKMTTASTKVTKLVISALRKGDKVKLTCSGQGCAFKSKAVKTVAGKANMLKMFSKQALAPKAVVMIWITRPGAIGQVVKFTMAKGKAPKRTNMCMPAGKSKAQARC
jgi:hypothetical protein